MPIEVAIMGFVVRNSLIFRARVRGRARMQLFFDKPKKKVNFLSKKNRTRARARIKSVSYATTPILGLTVSPYASLNDKMNIALQNHLKGYFL